MDTENNKITYLNMIENVISRMSTLSSIFKGFSTTIIAGIAILGTATDRIVVLIVAALPLVSFAILDTYYLLLEHRYIDLYEEVRLGKHNINFDLSVTKNSIFTFKEIIQCVKSASFWLFYAIQASVAVILILSGGGII